MKIFVTGAAGQLGHAVRDCFQNHAVVAFTHSMLDICDIQSVRSALAKEKPDILINAASYNDVEKAEKDYSSADAVNRQGPENLSIATKELGVPVLHVSTDYVFNGKKKEAYHELDETDPLSVYAKTKWAGEAAVRSNNPKHYIVRTAWLFHWKGESFFKKMMRIAAHGPMKVVNDQFSSPTYAPHLAMALEKLILSKAYGTYHMAGQGVASRYDEFKLFLELMGLKLSIAPISNNVFKQVAPRPPYSPLTTIQVPRILLPPWEQGVKEFVNEIKSHGGIDILRS